MNVSQIQDRLSSSSIDGWLFYDFHFINPIAYEVLGLTTSIAYRRWFYWVPASGKPVKIVSAVEPASLDTLPGAKTIYRTWPELHTALRACLADTARVAMEYSPNNDIPYLSRVDGGTLDLIRSMTGDVVSSGPLAQEVVSTLDAEGQASHRRAGLALMAAKDALFAELKSDLSNDVPLDEYSVQQRFVVLMEAQGLSVEEPPIVAVNAHAGNPHYSPTPETASPLKRGDLLLVDYWARMHGEQEIFADYTWMAFAGTADEIPQRMKDVFAVAAQARDAGIAHMQSKFADGVLVTGAEVDDVTRKVIDDAGYGDNFLHRTGHSITTAVHGNGAHLDNIETIDTRYLLPNTCNSVEPGIYLQDFGVRTETNTLITTDLVEVTGGQLQTEITPLL